MKYPALQIAMYKKYVVYKFYTHVLGGNFLGKYSHPTGTRVTHEKLNLSSQGAKMDVLQTEVHRKTVMLSISRSDIGGSLQDSSCSPQYLLVFSVGKTKKQYTGKNSTEIGVK